MSGVYEGKKEPTWAGLLSIEYIFIMLSSGNSVLIVFFVYLHHCLNRAWINLDAGWGESSGRRGIYTKYQCMYVCVYIERSSKSIYIHTYHTLHTLHLHWCY